MIHAKIQALFQDLEQASIRWSIMRLPSGLDNNTGDVDLLVDPAHIDLARKVLYQCDLIQLPGWSPGLHFVGYDPNTDSWIWVHLVTELAFGPDGLLHTHAEAGCLDRRQRDAERVTLASDDAFWVLLLHCLLDKRNFPPKHRTRLGELVSEARTDGALAQVLAGMCPSCWDPARLIRLVVDADWTSLEQFAPTLATSWIRRERIGKSQIFWKRGSRTIDRLLNISYYRGLGVALLGPDGAGKSTLIEALRKSFIFPVRSVYMGLTGGLLPYVDRLQIPALVVPGRVFIFWCRYLSARYHQARGRLVIFDRYVYDYVVPTPYPLNWLRRVYRWVDGHTVPAPDLVLLLDAPGDVMFQRKGEYSPVLLEDWRQHFLTLQNRITNLEIVDTDRPKETVRADVIDRIWRQYVARWGKN